MDCHKIYWKDKAWTQEETMKYICKALENRADPGKFKISFFNTTVPKLFKYSYYLLMLCSNDRSSPESLVFISKLSERHKKNT